MKPLLRNILLALSVMLVWEIAEAGEPIGKVVSATPSLTAGNRPLKTGDDIFFMDHITTDGGGMGEFEFIDGTKLALGGGASVTIDQFVFKDKSTLQKLGLAVTSGTFRWISGGSAHSAYVLKTPMGTMGVRGTGYDVTVKNGRTYAVLLNGNAEFCADQNCQDLQRSGDFLSADGQTVSAPQPVTKVFKTRNEAGGIFPYLANPRLLSPRFHVPGSDLLSDLAFGGSSDDDTLVERTALVRKAVTGAPACLSNCGGDPGGGSSSGIGARIGQFIGSFGLGTYFIDGEISTADFLVLGVLIALGAALLIGVILYLSYVNRRYSEQHNALSGLDPTDERRRK